MSSDVKIPEWAMEEAVAFEKDLPSKINGANRVFIRAVLARALLAAEQRGMEKAATLVEQAFRDGLAYGSNTENADPDIAWGHSRARSTLNSRENKE